MKWIHTFPVNTFKKNYSLSEILAVSFFTFIRECCEMLSAVIQWLLISSFVKGHIFGSVLSLNPQLQWKVHVV